MKRRIKVRKRKARSQTGVVGIAWYRPWQWERLREISSDRDELEQTYAEWLDLIQKRLPELHAAGMYPVKVDVDAEELLGWCTGKGLPVNGESRAQFVAEKTRAGSYIPE